MHKKIIERDKRYDENKIGWSDGEWSIPKAMLETDGQKGLCEEVTAKLDTHMMYAYINFVNLGFNEILHTAAIIQSISHFTRPPVISKFNKQAFCGFIQVHWYKSANFILWYNVSLWFINVFFSSSMHNSFKKWERLWLL